MSGDMPHNHVSTQKSGRVPGKYAKPDRPGPMNRGSPRERRTRTPGPGRHARIGRLTLRPTAHVDIRTCRGREATRGKVEFRPSHNHKPSSLVDLRLPVPAGACRGAT